jgi:hypothetical protein
MSANNARMKIAEELLIRWYLYDNRSATLTTTQQVDLQNETFSFINSPATSPVARDVRVTRVINILGNIFLAILLVATANGILVLCHQQWHFWSFNAGIFVLGIFMFLRQLVERDKKSL